MFNLTGSSDALEKCLTQNCDKYELESELYEMQVALDTLLVLVVVKSMHQVPGNHVQGHQVFEELPLIFSILVQLVKKPPKLELKQLPEHLKYAYLGESETLPVIIASKVD